MRPEGPWKWLHRCPKADGGSYIHTFLLTHFPIPDGCHLQQPTGYHTVLVGHPRLLLPMCVCVCVMTVAEFILYDQNLVPVQQSRQIYVAPC